MPEKHLEVEGDIENCLFMQENKVIDGLNCHTRARVSAERETPCLRAISLPPATF